MIEWLHQEKDVNWNCQKRVSLGKSRQSGEMMNKSIRSP